MPTYYWVGSTAQSVNSFNFNNASNWRIDGYVNGRYTNNLRTSFSPGIKDTVNIGSIYGPTAFSPCLFGGYSGGVAGGNQCWPGSAPATAAGSAAGTTTQSSLQQLQIGNNRNYSSTFKAQNPRGYGVYPFPFIGGGLTGDILTWIASPTGGTGATAAFDGFGWTGINSQVITSAQEQGLRVKTQYTTIYGLQSPGSVVQTNFVNNYTAPNGSTSITAAFSNSSYLDIRGSKYADGHIKVSGVVNTLAVRSPYSFFGQGLGSAELHHLTSETIEFAGVTASVVTYDNGCVESIWDENCTISGMVVNAYPSVATWNGPITFNGLVDNKIVRNLMDLGLSGATGSITATGGAGWVGNDKIVLNNNFYNSTTDFYGNGMDRIGGLQSQAFPIMAASTFDGISGDYNFRPTFFLGTQNVSKPVVCPILEVNAQSTVPSSGLTSSIAQAPSWAFKIGGQANINLMKLNGTVLSASLSPRDGGATGTQDLWTMPLDKPILISSLELSNNALLDLTANPVYNAWRFGTITNGRLNGGIFFMDETSTIKGSKDMRLVNDTVIANGTWSPRFGKPENVAGQIIPIFVVEER